MSKKIAVFPEPGAIGPAMNLVGICQGLREIGHDPVFVLEPGLKDTAASYGFEEHYVSCMEPMSAEAQARYWDDFMIKYMPTFKTSAYEQIATYVKGCWEAIIYTSEWSVKNGLDKVIAEIKPDLIIEAGTYKGGSAVLWAIILEHINPDGRVITIDINGF